MEFRQTHWRFISLCAFKCNQKWAPTMTDVHWLFKVLKMLVETLTITQYVRIIHMSSYSEEPYVCLSNKKCVINNSSTRANREHETKKCNAPSARALARRFEFVFQQIFGVLTLQHNIFGRTLQIMCENMENRKSCSLKYGYFIRCWKAFNRLRDVYMTSFSECRLQIAMKNTVCAAVRLEQ